MNTHPHYKGQCVLLKWFRTQENYSASWSRLKVVCTSLNEIFEAPKDSNYSHRYVYPLIALGLLEYGENKIGLSAPIILEYPSKSISLNCPVFQNHLEENERESLYSSHLIQTPVSISNVIKGDKVRCQKVVGSELSYLPDFNQIIGSWKETFFYRAELNEFQIMERWGWRKPNHENGYIDGLYRATDEHGARRYFKRKDKWYIIPNYVKNPDGSRIAYSKTIKGSQLSYNKSTQCLELKHFMFPLIIQRLLFRVSGFDYEYRGKNLVFNNISQSNYNRLNMIMHGK